MKILGNREGGYLFGLALRFDSAESASEIKSLDLSMFRIFEFIYSMFKLSKNIDYNPGHRCGATWYRKVAQFVAAAVWKINK